MSSKSRTPKRRWAQATASGLSSRAFLSSLSIFPRGWNTASSWHHREDCWHVLRLTYTSAVLLCLNALQLQAIFGALSRLLADSSSFGALTIVLGWFNALELFRAIHIFSRHTQGCWSRSPIVLVTWATSDTTKTKTYNPRNHLNSPCRHPP